MRRRGPNPKGEYAEKSAVLSTRIREDTRQALTDASKASGRSLSQEIEYRLRRSFDDDARIVDIFGGQQNYAVLRLLSGVMSAVSNPFLPATGWLDDPYRFNQVLKIINTVLEEFRPIGNPELQTQDEGTRIAGELQAGTVSAMAVDALKRATNELPLDPKNNPFPRIKSDLAPVAARVGNQPGRGIAMGNWKDILRQAEELERREKEQKQ
jgi:hypothetical protein